MLSLGGATAGGKPVTWPKDYRLVYSHAAPPLRSVARRTADLVESRRSPRLPRPVAVLCRSVVNFY